MSNDLVDRLKKIQDEVIKAGFNLDHLRSLQKTTKAYFDERINQLIIDHDLAEKVKVPRDYIRLWKVKGKQIQIPINWRYLISAPFIYGMLIPSLIWHISIEIYHQICFRLYGIPRVNFREYFVNDRQLLSQLNLWEKINCIYCSYVNNLIRYSVEIGGRTERYWCPIKYYRRVNHAHSQYAKFIDTKKSAKLREQWEELREFKDLT